MRIFILGYPGDLGGACTELWHTIKLWRKFDVDVHLIPTWYCEPKWRSRAEELGCMTHATSADSLKDVPGLPGSMVISFCNDVFLDNAATLRELGCKLIWVNCMTWLFDAEKKFYDEHGPFEAFVFQSKFQRDELEPQLEKFGYRSDLGHLINGAFDPDEWDFQPLAHGPDEPFVVGRAARPDADKWSCNTWPIYKRIQYPHKRALMLGVNDRTQQKLGDAPPWADCLKPRALSAQKYFSCLHCTLPVNGGARENWPRVGLEAMAMGVPVVAQNKWGWKEMVQHGVTGFLGDTDEELAHWVATLAYDEDLRMKVVRAARNRLVDDLANPNRLWGCWQKLFEQLCQSDPVAE